jgi:ABC-2 type transport system permease protein
MLTALRATVLLVAGWILGAGIAWGRGISALVILALLVAAHWGIGLVSAALVVAFRTPGPVNQAVMAVSMLFGGVYYPTSAIPSWLGVVSQVTPLAYGLRALRRVLLQGEGLWEVRWDVGILTATAVILLMFGSICMRASLQYARRNGSLGAY